jgi:hypothetical protein
MNVKNLVLGIGIIIVFGLVLHYGIEAFYQTPQYDQYCNSSRYYSYPVPEKLPAQAVNCTYSKALREAENKCFADKGQPVYDYDDNGCNIAVKECDFCNKYYEEAQDTHAKTTFIISIIAGIIAILLGYAILSTEPVGSALLGSGIWAFFYGAVINWRNLSNIWRFLLLLAALILLIWIAIRLNRPKKSKWQFWKK